MLSVVYPCPPRLQYNVKHEARNSMSLSPIKEKLLNPCYLTLSRRCIIIGTRFASITAWTCCWFPAVMLDRNHTASCKIKGCEKLLIQIVFYIIFYFYYKISYIHIFRSAIRTLVNLKYNQVCIGLIVHSWIPSKETRHTGNKMDSLALGDSMRLFSLSLLPSYNQILQTHRLKRKIIWRQKSHKATNEHSELLPLLRMNAIAVFSWCSDELQNALQHHIFQTWAVDDNMFFTYFIMFLLASLIKKMQHLLLKCLLFRSTLKLYDPLWSFCP